MKKFFGALAVTLLLSLIYVGISLTLAPDVNAAKRCFVTKMNSISLCKGNQNYVALNDISKYLVDAILISEDVSFYHHNGFDWYELKQSVVTDLERGKFARGGSTITQQLAKNLFLSGEKSITRKITEAYLTYKLEHTFSKNQILEKYFNIIELGPNIYGIKQASEHYFHKSPSQLTFLEGAYLAQLLPNPITYSKSF